VEREIAILFANLRGFTQLSEHKLPYDVVFILNRYFAEMGAAVESAGGKVDKFMGDGVMALFGLDCGPELACRQALAAARDMSARLEGLNATLAADLNEPLRIGIGIHCGHAIVGEMGYGGTIGVTAIGDAVNTASRLESLCKTYACELVVSQEAADRAGVDFSAYPLHTLEIRGRQSPLAARTVSHTDMGAMA
jgi:adenylate cyclase